MNVINNACILLLVSILLLTSPSMASESTQDPNLELVVKSIVLTVESIRELKFKHDLKMGTQTVQELRHTLESLFQKEFPRKEIEKKQIYLRTMGFIKEDLDLKKTLLDMYTEQVIGFYNPYTKSMYLVDRPALFSTNSPTLAYDSVMASHMKVIPKNFEQKLILSHELVHALQDEYYHILDLQGTKKNFDDQLSALEAVLEGDALLTMMYYLLESMGLNSSYFTQFENFMNDKLNDLNIPGMETFQNAPEYLKKHILFSYLDGLHFVYYIQSRKGWQDLAKVYKNLPITTEQILHPEKYFQDYDSPTIVTLPKLNDSSSNFNTIEQNTMGELDLKILFQQFLDEEMASKYSAGWDGDRYEISRNKKDNSLALRWVLTFDSITDAKECFIGFKQLLPKIIPDLTPFSTPDSTTKSKWTLYEKYFFIEVINKDLFIVYNIPRPLFPKIMKQLKKTVKTSLNKKIPRFNLEPSKPSSMIDLFKKNLPTVNLDESSINNLVFKLHRENISLVLPSNEWNMKTESLYGNVSQLVLKKNDGSAEGQMMILQLPIPLASEDIAMSLELGSMMAESKFSMEKISSGYRQFNSKKAYELVYKNPMLSSQISVIQMVIIPSNDKMIILTFTFSNEPTTELKKDIGFIIENINEDG